MRCGYGPWSATKTSFIILTPDRSGRWGRRAVSGMTGCPTSWPTSRENRKRTSCWTRSCRTSRRKSPSPRMKVSEGARQGILKEKYLYNWPPVWMVWNQLYDNHRYLMTTDNFCFYLQNRLIQASKTGGQSYRTPFSIPCARQWYRLI